MKKLAKSFLVILMGLFMSVNVMADVQTGKTGLQHRLLYDRGIKGRRN